ncbi:tyrosine--tRNA ligase [Orientia chuto str. Dubai]|uniref:Tyrosine--tRNA ligase n=1 Tax=Orientia chuto str. Dubai TaxID=1359168 RepID=A0A0F3MNC7_9RICK|nr:tyrosine--tRNA ligase [Candidatus Orientia mediorientalis]KJV57278.1 tyrosine--tRNA ligase [Orientia chuto str. Dubai]
MSFINKFINQGYFYQSTNLITLKQISNRGQLTAYIGFDCTAKSLHVGNLMQIMVLRLLQQYSHRAIIVIGGATTKIGDPSGKDKLRRIITNEEIQQNIVGIKKSLSKFIKFDKNDILFLNNQEWLDSLNYVNFLRDYGSLFSINKMLTMNSVKSRLERHTTLSFLEFNYMLLQAYDFYYLNKHYNCNLQIGGSDQWGNITMGVDLVKKLSGTEVFGLTTPLITNSSGKKMGKTVDGAIWLNEDMCSPYNYFQYWRNIEDDYVIRFAKLYGEFSALEIAKLKELSLNNINEAKKQVAYKITLLCHGEEEANKALNTAIQIFEHKTLDENLPTFTLTDINAGIPITTLLLLIGFAKTKSEGKRLIQGNGIKINNVKVTDTNLIIQSQNFINQVIKVSLGKKHHVVVKIT